jgi:hypothetical protein
MPGGRRFLTAGAEATTAADLARIFRERDETFRADLREDVTAGIADGTIRPDVPTEETAVAILAQLRGIGLQRLVDSPAIDTERLRQTVTGYWHRALALPQPPA